LGVAGKRGGGGKSSLYVIGKLFPFLIKFTRRAEETTPLTGNAVAGSIDEGEGPSRVPRRRSPGFFELTARP